MAEDSLAFEHRDLHWGNVMLRPAAAANSHVTARLRGSTLRAATCGAEVTLIDFTASRLQTPGGDVAFCNLEAEEGLFDGPKGKPQFETYRCVGTCGDLSLQAWNQQLLLVFKLACPGGAARWAREQAAVCDVQVCEGN